MRKKQAAIPSCARRRVPRGITGQAPLPELARRGFAQGACPRFPRAAPRQVHVQGDKPPVKLLGVRVIEQQCVEPLPFRAVQLAVAEAREQIGQFGKFSLGYPSCSPPFRKLSLHAVQQPRADAAQGVIDRFRRSPNLLRYALHRGARLVPQLRPAAGPAPRASPRSPRTLPTSSEPRAETSTGLAASCSTRASLKYSRLRAWRFRYVNT